MGGGAVRCSARVRLRVQLSMCPDIGKDRKGSWCIEVAWVLTANLVCCSCTGRVGNGAGVEGEGGREGGEGRR